ncbi:MAG: tRNA pseudouridine(38-40) synthase TruA [Crocinitomicaceae bacterium]
MQRYFIELAYNGEEYYGWQRQPRQISIQEVIEGCLTKLNSNNEVKVLGCGRTDTGVHANHFILHTEISAIEDTEKFIFKMNSMLPQSIVIYNMFVVKENSHARFNATSRTYRYFIHRNKDPFKQAQSWLLRNDLDLVKMNEAAQHLIGKQDFTSLSKIHTDVKTNICNVQLAHWVQLDNGACYFEITADRFLRNMVRATVGTLVDVGMYKSKPDYIRTILDAMERQAASTSVPARGLFLWKVEYPKDI